MKTGAGFGCEACGFALAVVRFLVRAVLLFFARFTAFFALFFAAFFAAFLALFFALFLLRFFACFFRAFFDFAIAIILNLNWVYVAVRLCLSRA